MQVTPMVVKILSDGRPTAQKAIAYAEDYVRRFGGDVSVVEATPEDASALLGGLKVRLPRLFWGEPGGGREVAEVPEWRPGAFLSAFPIPKGARGKAVPRMPASKSQEKRIAAQSEPAPATTSKPKAPIVPLATASQLSVLAGKIEAQDASMAELARAIGAEVGKVAAKVDSALKAIGNVTTVVNADGEAPKQRAASPDGSVRQFVEAQVSTSTAQVHAHIREVDATSEKRDEEILGILRDIRESL